MRMTLDLDGERFEVEVQRTAEGLRVECEDARLDLRGRLQGDAVELRAGDQQWLVQMDEASCVIGGRRRDFFVSGFAPGLPVAAQGQQGRVPVRAVMHGRLVKVLLEKGAEVRKGQPLFVLEAMKMQNELVSPADGVVAEIVGKPGDVVDVGRILAWLQRGKE